MTDASNNPIPSPEQQRLSECARRDIKRHRVMLGHPQTGQIFQPPSADEIKRRTEKLKKRSSGLKY